MPVGIFLPVKRNHKASQVVSSSVDLRGKQIKIKTEVTLKYEMCVVVGGCSEGVTLLLMPLVLAKARS